MVMSFCSLAIRRVHTAASHKKLPTISTTQWLQSVTTSETPDALLNEFVLMEKQLTSDQVVAVFQRLSQFPHLFSPSSSHSSSYLSSPYLTSSSHDLLYPIKLAVRKRCSQFQPVHFNFTVRATNTMRISDPRFQVSVFSHLNLVYHKYTLQEKMFLFIALVNYPTLDQNFLQFLVKDFRLEVKKMTHGELALMTHTFARLNVLDLPLFDSLRDSAIFLLERMSPLQISQVLSAWLSWGMCQESLIYAACHSMMRKIKGATVGELCVVFNTLVRFEKDVRSSGRSSFYDNVLMRMCEEVKKRSKEPTSDEITLVFTALAKFQPTIQDDFIASLCDVTKSKLNDFSSSSFAQLLTALAKLNVSDPSLFTTLFAHANTLSFFSPTEAAALLKVLLHLPANALLVKSYHDQASIAQTLIKFVPIPVGVSLYADELATVFQAIRAFNLYERCEGMVESLCATTLALPNSMLESQHVSEILVSLCSLRHMDRPLIQKLSTVLYALPRLDCEPQQTVDLLSTLAQFSLYNGRLVSSMCAQILVSAHEFEPDQAVQTLHSLTMMRHYAQDVFEALRIVLQTNTSRRSAETLVLLDEVNLALTLDQPTWHSLPSSGADLLRQPLSAFHEQVSRALNCINIAHTNQHLVSGLQIDIAIQSPENILYAIQLGIAPSSRAGLGELSGRSLFKRRLLRQMGWSVIEINDAQWPLDEIQQKEFLGGLLASAFGPRPLFSSSSDVTREDRNFHSDFIKHFAGSQTPAKTTFEGLYSQHFVALPPAQSDNLIPEPIPNIVVPTKPRKPLIRRLKPKNFGSLPVW